MAAIALAESRGDPRARHVNSDGSVDYGLWQINSSNLSRSQTRAIYGPNENAREAVRLAEHSSKGLKNWTTFLTGKFRGFLPKKKTAKPKNTGVFSQANYAGTDQGVDFRGAGPIPALASGVVTDVGRASIIEGQRVWYVIYRLLSGPYKGQYVYVAENFVPSVKKGQRLKAGQSVGRALGKFPYIEVGFNKTGNGWNPVASLYPNPHGAKPAGSKMWQYIQGVTGLHPGGSGGFGGAVSSAGSAIATGASDIWNFNPIGSITSAAGDATGIHPEAWVKETLMKGVDAMAILGGGFVFLSGLILIAADIGLSSRAGKTAEQLYITKGISKVGKSRTSTPTARTSTSTSEARERRAEESHQAKLKLTQARTTEARTRQKNRRRTRKEQEQAEQKAYYRGATDAASPTMTKIRRSKKK